MPASLRQDTGPFRFQLVPDSDEALHPRPAAGPDRPAWLRIEPAGRVPRGRWVRFRYSSSIFADNVRPLLRITRSGVPAHVQPMTGTLMGVGEWVGWIPRDALSVELSPGDAVEPSDFRIDRITPVSTVGLWLRGTLANPHVAIWALRHRGRVSAWELERNLKADVASTPLTEYGRWVGRRTRALELEGIDRPRTDWKSGPTLRILLELGGDGVPGLRDTLRSLSAQVYERWSLHVLVDPALPESVRSEARRTLAAEPRASEVGTSTPLSALAAHPGAGDVVACIAPGDLVPDYAFAVVGETLARRPEVVVLYGDEDAVSASGALHAPILRPDWSPVLHAARPYLGLMTFVRVEALLAAGLGDVERALRAARGGMGEVVDTLDRAAVHHARRILYRRRREESERPPEPRGPSTGVRRHEGTRLPAVEVIVPTRDNPECLATCIGGLTDGTDHPGLHVTVVDNGSRDGRTVALLRELRRRPDVRVLERPGPFNFSALCNDAARETGAPVLLFLNDDVEITDPRWLEPLLALAVRPDVGAVGAKLLFGDGRIQHAGVTLGWRGIGGGHRYHGQPSATPGYLGRLTVAHEVGAVTGACLAVEREKFEAVGGFDAERLPVEWNDLDLCLRLDARGYATVWTPESVLVHHESTSRGRTPMTDVRHRDEWTYFLSRWQERIRDDPWFHPDLSLYSRTAGLA